MSNENTIAQIEQKYKRLGENPETYLKGLLHSKPMNYWDYIEVDTLLSLQKPRTDFKDEPIFIMYHQVTELVLKLIIHELEQIVEPETISEEEMTIRLHRINRYTSMLMTTFDVMREGMDYDQYNTFRLSLAPASGFQSAQFRKVEFYCTRLINLVNEEGRKRLPENPGIKDYFAQLYWKDAGTCRHSGHQSLTLRQFEERYMKEFIGLAVEMEGRTLEERVNKLPAVSEGLKRELREFDRLFNIEWPMVHLNTARHYLDSKGENKEATGGSEWKNYLHPMHQQRKFFPEMWTENEIQHWGEEK
jgi:tryptophan 2,3-dioxygenase